MVSVLGIKSERNKDGSRGISGDRPSSEGAQVTMDDPSNEKGDK